MISFNFDEYCCGCGSCKNSCPVNAIAMKANFEGFLMPEINKEICINCDKCDKVCPYENTKVDIEKFSLNDFDNKKAYLYYSSKSERKDSASGGFVYDLSRRIVDDGGFVCGCVWNIDMKAHHIVSNKARDLRRMQSSKYVQSDTELCFAAIKKLLKEGKEVMFCGTPCQTAGLHHFLGKSDISKLISVCLICHGVPSPLVWEKYKKAIEVKYKGHLVGVNMRDKSKEGYSTSYCKYTFTSLSKNECREEIGHTLQQGTRYVCLQTFLADPYVFLFTDNLYIRNSCTHCPYKSDNSQADIIVGDFYASTEGAGNGGCSCMIALTPKGENVIKRLDGVMKQSTAKAVGEVNPMIYKSVEKHPLRAKFFGDLQNETDGNLNLFTKYLPVRFHVKKALAQLGIFNSIKKMLYG